MLYANALAYIWLIMLKYVKQSFVVVYLGKLSLFSYVILCLKRRQYLYVAVSLLFVPGHRMFIGCCYAGNYRYLVYWPWHECTVSIVHSRTGYSEAHITNAATSSSTSVPSSGVSAARRRSSSSLVDGSFLHCWMIFFLNMAVHFSRNLSETSSPNIITKSCST